MVEEAKVFLPDGFSRDVFTLDAGQSSAQDARLISQSCQLINGGWSRRRKAKLFGPSHSVVYCPAIYAELLRRSPLTSTKLLIDI